MANSAIIPPANQPGQNSPIIWWGVLFGVIVVVYLAGLPYVGFRMLYVVGFYTLATGYLIRMIILHSRPVANSTKIWPRSCLLLTAVASIFVSQVAIMSAIEILEEG